jgi:hypothetical protein
MLTWLDNIIQKGQISFVKLSTGDFVTTLLDLFLYEDEKLTKSVFELLHKTFH